MQMPRLPLVVLCLSGCVTRNSIQDQARFATLTGAQPEALPIHQPSQFRRFRLPSIRADLGRDFENTTSWPFPQL